MISRSRLYSAFTPGLSHAGTWGRATRHRRLLTSPGRRRAVRSGPMVVWIDPIEALRGTCFFGILALSAYAEWKFATWFLTLVLAS
jgi:hypothetical protein